MEQVGFSFVVVALASTAVLLVLLRGLAPAAFLAAFNTLVSCLAFIRSYDTVLSTLTATSVAALIFAVLVVSIQPHTASLVRSTVCPPPTLWTEAASESCHYHARHPPAISHFIFRAGLVADIIDAINHDNFVVLDGANRMGKTTVAESVAAQLSETHAVQIAECAVDDTANSVLVKLLIPRHSLVEQVLSVLPTPFRPTTPSHSSAAISEALLHLPEYRGHEPVFMVEMAERLSVGDLKTLLDLAKVLADKRRGRFIFVFSPSVKLSDISGFGAMTRASIVSVGDLTETEALGFLEKLQCDDRRAKAVHELVDGHLPYLLDAAVRSFCRGTLPLGVGGLKKHFTQLVRAIFEHVDSMLKCKGGCACKAACAVRDKEWDHVDLDRSVALLLKEHIVRASLAEKVHKIDSRFVQCYVARECGCNHTGYVVAPPCG